MAIKRLLRSSLLLAVAASALAWAGHAAQPGTVYYKNFDDGNADGWIVDQGSWSIANGSYCQTYPEIYGSDLNPALGGRMRSHIRGSNYADFDAAVEAVVLSSPTEEREMALIFRAKDLQNFYHLRWLTGYTGGDDHLQLWKYVNGTGVLLGQMKVDAMPVGTRAVFRLSAKGGMLKAQVLAKGKGASSTRWLSVTDTAYASGLFGLDTYHTAGCFNDVSVGS